MKTRTLLSTLILAFVLMIIAAGYATEKKITKKDYRFVSGTWINEKYNSHIFSARYEMYRDGKWDGYNRISDTGKESYGYYIIVDKWTDSEGNTWIKMHTGYGQYNEGPPSTYDLNKFSKNGNVWETIGDKYEFPTEIDESDLRYRIYYRQE